MGIFSWFKTNKAEPQRAAPYTSPIPARTYSGWADALRDCPGKSGVIVNEQTALGVSAVWCAIRVISESIGKLPILMYRANDQGGHDPDPTHPLVNILDVEPNPEQTARVFWETYMSHALLWGNAYAEILREDSGRPVALFIIHPSLVQVERAGDKRNIVYKVQGVEKPLAPEYMLHLPGLGADGSYGYSLLRIARESIGYTIAADTFGQRFFGQGAMMGGTLSFPPGFDDTAKENVIKSWKDAYSGVENAGKWAALEDGVAVSKFEFSAEAAQYNETRRFQITEVSRLFNITPSKLHEMGRATWGNLSTTNQDFWDTTCAGWAGKIEAEIARKLLSVGERGKVFPEFDADSLTRGDRLTRYQANALACGGPWETINEVRAREGRAPVAGGDEIAKKQPDPKPADQEQPGQQPGDQGEDVNQDTNQEGTNE